MFIGKTERLLQSCPSLSRMLYAPSRMIWIHNAQLAYKVQGPKVKSEK